MSKRIGNEAPMFLFLEILLFCLAFPPYLQQLTFVKSNLHVLFFSRFTLISDLQRIDSFHTAA